MKINLKKTLSGFLAFVLVVSVIPGNTLVIATDSQEIINSEDVIDTDSDLQNEAKIDGVEYATLQEAVDKAADGSTIELLKDVTLQGGNSKDAEAGLYIERSLTLNGNGYTIDCGKFTKGIRLYNVDGQRKNYTFKSVNVINSNAYGRCVDTRAGNIELTMSGVNLTSEGTNSQPLTVGGRKQIYRANIDNCTINAGKSGYGIICFVKTSSGFKLTSTKISGLAALYVKEGSNGSIYNIGGNCELIGNNNYTAASGAFGTIVLEGDNNTVKLTAKTATVVANADSTATQGVFNIRGIGNNLYISHDATFTANGNSTLVVGSEEGLAGSTYYDKFFNFGLEEESSFVPVAVVDDIAFLSFEEAWKHAADGSTVKLLTDVATSESFINKQDITLDLNGHTITGTDNSEKSFALITNKGNLTITGNGTMTLTASNNRGWNAYSSVISNTVGGKLTVENGTIEHLGGTDMAYGIDNLTNGKGTYAETIINGGTIKSTYRAIRQFLNGVEAQNILTVKGGTIEGANKSIWFQDPSKNANSGTLIVDNNAVLNGDVYLYVTPGSTEWPVNVFIAADALAEGYSVVTGNIPEQYDVKEVDGVYGKVSYAALVGAALVGAEGYETFDDAWAAAKDGDTIKLLTDLTVDTETFKIADGVSITLDMNGKKITVADNNASANYELFYIYGGLTVTGNGTIELTASTNRYWNASSSIFHNRGGVLNIENGTFTHNGGTDMAYVVDNSGNYFGDATTNIEGGTLNSSYIAIRNRMEQNSHGASGTAYLNVSGGIVTGVKRAIWAQAASTSTTAPATGEINISGGEINGLVQTPAGNGSQCLTSVSGGTVTAFQGEYGELTVTGGKIETTTLLAVDGQEAVAHIGKVGYSSLMDAIEAAKDSNTISLLSDISLENTVLSITKDITIDLNGYTISGYFTEKTTQFISIENGAEVIINDNGKGGIKATSIDGVLSNLIRAQSGSKLTINGGNYYQDYSVNGAGMIDSRGDEIITIIDGTFNLGNLGTKSNGSPWLLNASGQNTKNIIVKGGNFQADIAHQYYPFEVMMPKEKALKCVEGIYTVVDAVAYVTEREWSSKWYTNEVGYATLEEAIAACEGPKDKVYYKKTYTSEQEVVVLLKDITLEDAIVIETGKSVVLDLNEYSIKMTTADAQSMITNEGNLTIQGTGEIAINYTATTADSSKAVNAIANRGSLTVKGGTISNTANVNNQIGYAIDNYNGATLTVNGGVISATGSGYYDGIRLFCGNKETVVTVNGGEISSIWAQNPSNNKASEVKGTIVINNGKISVTYYENYTTVKVKSGVNANVQPYGAGERKDPSVEDDYTVYSFKN